MKAKKPLPEVRTGRKTRLNANLAASGKRIRSPERLLLFGDVLKPRAFFQGFARIAKAAGLDGRSKMLRRTSGSMIEREHPGEGHTHLGNGRGVFERHYLARRIAPITARFPVFSVPSDN